MTARWGLCWSYASRRVGDFSNHSANCASVRDRGVGGSNPLAPTKFSSANPRCSVWVAARFRSRGMPEPSDLGPELRTGKLNSAENSLRKRCGNSRHRAQIRPAAIAPVIELEDGARASASALGLMLILCSQPSRRRCELRTTALESDAFWFIASPTQTVRQSAVASAAFGRCLADAVGEALNLAGSSRYFASVRDEATQMARRQAQES
jgi:hypothetical protein